MYCKPIMYNYLLCVTFTLVLSYSCEIIFFAQVFLSLAVLFCAVLFYVQCSFVHTKFCLLTNYDRNNIQISRQTDIKFLL